MATAGVGLVLAALPVFLVGGLAVQVRGDLDLGEAALGASVAGSFLVGAVAAPVAGRVADRLGSVRSVLLGAAWSLASAGAIAALATSWATLTAALSLAGLGFAFMDPGLALLVQSEVPPDRQGSVLGVKEAAIPTATLLAGLAIPTIALATSWRWSFVVVVPIAVALLALLARSRSVATSSVAALAGGVALAEADHAARAVTPGPNLGPGPGPASARSSGRAAERAGRTTSTAWWMALAAALGGAAASGVGIFLTDTAVARGFSPTGAGLLLTAGSVVGIATRLAVGMRADRRVGSPLATMGTMLAIGSVAMAVGALASDLALVVGTLGTFSAGWGWSALLFLGILRLHPAAAGRATGIALAGLAAGNALGPLAFGALAESASPRSAWLAAALSAAVAAVVVTWRVRQEDGGRVVA